MGQVTSDGLAGFASRNIHAFGFGVVKFIAMFVTLVSVLAFVVTATVTGFLCHKDNYAATVIDKSFFREMYSVTVTVDDVPDLVVKQDIDFAVWRNVKLGDRMVVRMTPRGTYKQIVETQLEAP